MKEKICNLSTNQRKVIAVLLAAVIAAIFCIIFTHTIWQPINEEEFGELKEIAQDVYEQKKSGAVLYEVPDGVNVEDNETTIKVSYNNGLKFGSVTVRMQDGKPVFELEQSLERRIALNICSTLVVFLIGILLLLYPWRKK